MPVATSPKRSALAVLDLPFEAGKPDVKFAGAKMTYTPKGPAVAFHE